MSFSLGGSFGSTPTFGNTSTTFGTGTAPTFGFGANSTPSFGSTTPSFGASTSSFGAPSFGGGFGTTGTTFGSGTSFGGGTSFGTGTSFGGSTFGTGTSFGSGSFGTGTSFGAGTTFGTGTSFGTGSFGTGTSFGGSSFGTGTSFGGSSFGTGSGFNFGTGSTTSFGTGTSFFGGSTFGNTSQPFGTGSSFLGGGGNMFGAQPAPVNPDDPLAQAAAIEAAYRKDVPDCQFQCIFYNRADPRTTPSNCPPLCKPALWAQAQKSNPDPRNYVPVHGVGFEALQTRNKEADKAVEEFTKVLQNIKTKLDEMKQLHMQHTFKIEQLRQEHCRLSNRLLKVMSAVEIDRSRGYGLMIQEVDFHKKLQQMDRRLEKPGQFRSKVKEMESLVSREGGESALDSGLAVDQNSSKDLFEFLQTQKEAMGQLTIIIQQDLPVLSTIVDGLKTELKTNVLTIRQ